MSYCVVIEGAEGVRRVQAGILPRRGEWIAVELDQAWRWFPVLEVAHALSREERLKEPETGCHFEHAQSEHVVFSSLALAVRAEVRSADESFKLVLPPSRWPFGGNVYDRGEDRQSEKQ